jgi:hypothetical protein
MSLLLLLPWLLLQLPPKLAVVLGSEASGISSEMRAAADRWGQVSRPGPIVHCSSAQCTLLAVSGPNSKIWSCLL